MASNSEFNTAGLFQGSGVSSVFASGTPVAGGIVGCADIVFYDSPPLQGVLHSRTCPFNHFGRVGLQLQPDCPR
jgi:hypothetical protein